MGEAIGRLIGFLFVGIFSLIFGGIGAIFRAIKEGNANSNLLANAKKSEGVIVRTPPIIPLEARFEHTHILAGSGHGKTQLLQKMILEDMQALKEGKGSLAVIDSQGDLINKIVHLADMRDLKDKLILIDPNNIEYPPALNLFDFGLGRLDTYNALERERLLNGAVALYEYLFGALLGAELTMRQNVVFRYVAKLLVTVEGATIHTMLEFIESPDTIRPYLDRVDRTTRHFFESQFFSPAFKETRQQIQARLWGVLSNSTLERMFANEKNKLDIYSSLNSGCILLINTAKDLLKQDGCQIMGRFFIALIGQAVQERAVIPEDKRRSTFLYVDEAHDYFDDNLENLINQLRKYKVGLIIAHQNLGQLSGKLKETVMASTTTKIMGGLSASDAAVLAKQTGFSVEYLMSMKKEKDWTNFAVDVKNHSAASLGGHSFKIPYGMLENRKKLTQEEYDAIILENASKYAMRVPEPEVVTAAVARAQALAEPEMI